MYINNTGQKGMRTTTAVSAKRCGIGEMQEINPLWVNWRRLYGETGEHLRLMEGQRTEKVERHSRWNKQQHQVQGNRGSN